MDQEILKRLHDEMLTIYQEIARICDKHNLTYFVVGGTLLGAVVHKGYIPWDDDLDIAMPRDDYDLFINKYSKELGKDYYLHHTNTDPDYWLPFAKVRKNNTVFLEEKRKNVKSHAGIYVDVFPFDYAERMNTPLARIKWRLITYANNYINCKVTGRSIESKSGVVLNRFFDKLSIEELSIKRDQWMRSFDTGNRKYYVDLAGGRKLDNSYFPISIVLPIQDLSFAQTTVRAPSDPNFYLVTLYSHKYVIIPPKEKQVTHQPLLIRFEDGTEYRFEDIQIP